MSDTIITDELQELWDSTPAAPEDEDTAEHSPVVFDDGDDLDSDAFSEIDETS